MNTEQRLTGWKWLLMAAVLIVAMLAGWWAKARVVGGAEKLPEVVGANYTTNLPARVVAQLADNLGQVTRVKITTDNQLMFVTTLSGTVWVFTNQNGKFVKQAAPLYQINLGWREGAENGMTAVIISSDWDNDHNIFLTYAKSANGSTGQNQILKLTVGHSGADYVATSPKVIFTSNAVASGAHQIQGGASLMIEGKPHLLFALGENYRPDDAENLAREAGKIMLIQEDGENPLGARPYPNYPKIQVIGIRNIYDLAIDPINSQWVYWVENGNNAHDRVVHAPILDATKQFDGNWRDDDSLLTTLSVNGKQTDQYMVYVWDKTVSPDSVSADSLGRVYVGIFSSANDPTKQILMGEQDKNGKWSLKPIVTRKPDVIGGNLLGLTMSPQGDFYFGDFSDGTVDVLTKSWSLAK